MTAEPGKNRLPWSVRILTAMVFAGCGLYAAIFIYHGLRLVCFPFDVDNSEAYLVDQGRRLAQGIFLYQPWSDTSYVVDNYPPLYPLLESIVFLFSGPNFHWPRLISFASMLFTALFLARWTFRLAGRKSAAWFCALIFLSFYHVYDWGALARVDSLGLLLSVWGLWMFQKSGSWKKACPFFFLALLTKQTLFAAPLAVFFTLFFSSRRKEGDRFLTVLIASGMIFYFILALVTSGEATRHLILYNANTYRWRDLWYYLRHWLVFYTVWGCAPLVILAREAREALRNRGNSLENGNHFSLLFWYTVFSLGEAALCGKIGSAPNYLLSLVCATSVALGLIYHETVSLLARDSHRYVQTVGLFFSAACLLQLGGTAHWPSAGRYPWPHPLDWSYTPAQADIQAGTILLRELQRLPGPILTDRAGVALLAGHPPIFDPFLNTQLALEKRWDQSPLLALSEKREFTRAIFLFDLSDPNWDRERFTPEMIDALRKNYVFDRRVGHYFLYAPRP